MTLPKKREKPKMGVREPAQKVWRRHRRYVRSFGCSVPGCTTGAVIDFAHITSVGAGGQDWEGISLCRTHHSEQHTIGIETFARKYQMDLKQMAAEFTRTSPDTAMKDSARNLLGERT